MAKGKMIYHMTIFSIFPIGPPIGDNSSHFEHFLSGARLMDIVTIHVSGLVNTHEKNLLRPA
jgi:hypothetical protein